MRTPPVKKNDDISVTISGYTSDGAGIGRIEDFAVFVPGALIGETVNAHIIKVTASYAVGKFIALTSPYSSKRCEPICAYYDKCGGCNLQHMIYDEQLEFKRRRVEDALRKIGGVDFIVSPTLSSPDVLHFRNKASFPFGTVDGKVRLGFYAPRSHRLIPINDCVVQKKDTVVCMQTVEAWANKFRISAYDEEKRDGILRHLVVRSTDAGLLVCVVTSGNALPYADELIKALDDRLFECGSSLVGLVQNVNAKPTNVILGTKYKLVHGADSIDERLCGLNFRVRVPSFLQINHVQTENLYNIAIELLNLTRDDNVFDIYCGVGTITLLAARYAKHVTGIEYVREAVEDAEHNAKHNGITNVEFHAGAAERILPELVALGQSADAVILDPPRSGCDEDVLKAIAKSGAKRVVYVSCNPETLARDVKILSGSGYELRDVQPVDMFPQTEHVESVVLITRA